MRPRRRRARWSLQFLGVADEAFDDLEDWMVGSGEAPTAAPATALDPAIRA